MDIISRLVTDDSLDGILIPCPRPSVGFLKACSGVSTWWLKVKALPLDSDIRELRHAHKSEAISGIFAYLFPSC